MVRADETAVVAERPERQPGAPVDAQVLHREHVVADAIDDDVLVEKSRRKQAAVLEIALGAHRMPVAAKPADHVGVHG